MAWGGCLFQRSLQAAAPPPKPCHPHSHTPTFPEQNPITQSLNNSIFHPSTAVSPSPMFMKSQADVISGHLAVTPINKAGFFFCVLPLPAFVAVPLPHFPPPISLAGLPHCWSPSVPDAHPTPRFAARRPSLPCASHHCLLHGARAPAPAPPGGGGRGEVAVNALRRTPNPGHFCDARCLGWGGRSRVECVSSTSRWASHKLVGFLFSEAMFFWGKKLILPERV